MVSIFSNHTIFIHLIKIHVYVKDCFLFFKKNII